MLPKVLAVFFAISLLFETGFLYAVVDHESNSIQFGSFGSNYDTLTYNLQEETGAQWIQQAKSSNGIFSDVIRYPLIGQFGWGGGTAGREHVGENLSYFSIDENHALVSIPDGSEIFLGTYNLMFNEVAVRGLGNVFEEEHLHVALNPLVENRSKIYDNGGANIYYS